MAWIPGAFVAGLMDVVPELIWPQDG
jgi:hypothetical protein